MKVIQHRLILLLNIKCPQLSKPKVNFKGLVHPKMKNLSVFTHPHVVPNLYVFICSVEHKGRYLE